MVSALSFRGIPGSCSCIISKREAVTVVGYRGNLFRNARSMCEIFNSEKFPSPLLYGFVAGCNTDTHRLGLCIIEYILLLQTAELRSACRIVFVELSEETNC